MLSTCHLKDQPSYKQNKIQTQGLVGSLVILLVSHYMAMVQGMIYSWKMLLPTEMVKNIEKNVADDVGDDDRDDQDDDADDQEDDDLEKWWFRHSN